MANRVSNEEGVLENFQTTLDEAEKNLLDSMTELKDKFDEAKSEAQSEFDHTKEEHAKVIGRMLDEKSKVEQELANEKEEHAKAMCKICDEKSKVEQELANEKATLGKTKNELYSMRDTCVKLDEEKEDAVAKFDKQTVTFEKIKKDLNDKSIEYDKLADEKAVVETKNERLTAKLEQCKNECTTMSDKREVLAGENELQKKKIDRLTAKLGQNQQKLNTTSDDDENIAASEINVVTLTEELTETKERLEQERSKAEDAESRADKLQAEMNELQAGKREDDRKLIETLGELKKIEEERTEVERKCHEVLDISCLILNEPGMAANFITAKDEFMRRLISQLKEQKKSLRVLQIPPSGDLPPDAANLQKPHMLIMPCLAASHVPNSINSLMLKPAAKAGHTLLFVIFHPRAPHDKKVNPSSKEIKRLPTFCVKLVDIVFNRSTGAIFDGGLTDTAVKDIADRMATIETDQ